MGTRRPRGRRRANRRDGKARQHLTTRARDTRGVGASTLAIHTIEHDDNGIWPDEVITVRLGYLLNRSRSAVDTTESAGQAGIQPSQADSGGKALTCAAPVT